MDASLTDDAEPERAGHIVVYEGGTAQSDHHSPWAIFHFHNMLHSMDSEATTTDKYEGKEQQQAQEKEQEQE